MNTTQKKRRRQLGVALAATFATLGTAAQARAVVNCSTVGGSGTIIYGAGGSAQQPLIGQIASQLARLSPPVTIVYSDSGSACAGYTDLVTPTNITGSAIYWDATGTQQSCQVDTGGLPVTFAVMGNAPNLCTGVTGIATGFTQFLGPVQPIDFVVPSMSGQQSISTEAAYYIWGFGASDANHTVSPWITPANIFTRSASSFVALFVGLDTGVPVATVAAHGTSEMTNTSTVMALNGLNSGPNYESGIGFVSGEVADGNRSQIKVLAYQHTGQSCGYWPDSTKDAFDKVNVRSGQYWLWSPVHFFAATNSSGQITDTATANLIGYFTGDVTPPTGIDIFAAEKQAFTVPKCAMQAWRDGDLAAPYSYAPPVPCTCKFDIATNNANKASTCKACSVDSDCSTNHCRNIGPPVDTDGGTSVGYCEAY